ETQRRVCADISIRDRLRFWIAATGTCAVDTLMVIAYLDSGSKRNSNASIAVTKVCASPGIWRGWRNGSGGISWRMKLKSIELFLSVGRQAFARIHWTPAPQTR